MSKQRKQTAAQQNKSWPDLREHLIKECDSMIMYAFANGKKVDSKTVGNLEMVKKMEEPDSDGKDVALIAKIHNELQNTVAPALPSTISMFEHNKRTPAFWGFLGPVPLVRKLVLISIVSLWAMLGFSLFPEVNNETLNKGLLHSEGFTLMVNLLFLMSAAGVGASFSALYRANDFIVQGTYDPTYDATYWAQIVLGLVAGILLAELIPIPQNAETSMILAGDFAKPILSILGGFSARAVYSILNFFIEIIVNVVKKAGAPNDNGDSQALQEAKMSEKIANQRAEMMETMHRVNAKVLSGASPQEIQSEMNAVMGSNNAEEKSLLSANALKRNGGHDAASTPPAPVAQTPPPAVVPAPAAVTSTTTTAPPPPVTTTTTTPIPPTTTTTTTPAPPLPPPVTTTTTTVAPPPPPVTTTTTTAVPIPVVTTTTTTPAPAIHPDAVAMDPNQTAIHADSPAVVDPDAPAIDPNQLAVHPDSPAIDAGTMALHPDSPAVDPNAAAIDPDSPAVHTDASDIHPDSPAVDPDAAALDPDAPAVG